MTSEDLYSKEWRKRQEQSDSIISGLRLRETSASHDSGYDEDDIYKCLRLIAVTLMDVKSLLMSKMSRNDKS